VSKRRNLTVDLTRPTTKLGKTCEAILDLLTSRPGRVSSQEFREHLTDQVGTDRFRFDALKALGNQGHPIICHHMPYGKADFLYVGTISEYEECKGLVVERGFSELLTLVRKLRGLAAVIGVDDPRRAALVDQAQMLLVMMGQNLPEPLSMEQVIKECQPLL
jgi:hypothetical protein